MLLTNHDFHDLHAVFLILRAYPAEETNEIAVRAIKEILDAPQSGKHVSFNVIRSKLSAIKNLDREKWYFIDTQNIYTWGTAIVKDDRAYAILSACLDETLIALQEKNAEQISDLADALHNVPIILAEGGKKMLKNVKREVSFLYRTKWNNGFLKEFI